MQTDSVCANFMPFFFFLKHPRDCLLSQSAIEYRISWELCCFNRHWPILILYRMCRDSLYEFHRRQKRPRVICSRGLVGENCGCGGYSCLRICSHFWPSISRNQRLSHTSQSIFTCLFFAENKQHCFVNDNIMPPRRIWPKSLQSGARCGKGSSTSEHEIDTLYGGIKCMRLYM